MLSVLTWHEMPDQNIKQILFSKNFALQQIFYGSGQEEFLSKSWHPCNSIKKLTNFQQIIEICCESSQIGGNDARRYSRISCFYENEINFRRNSIRCRRNCITALQKNRLQATWFLEALPYGVVTDAGVGCGTVICSRSVYWVALNFPCLLLSAGKNLPSIPRIVRYSLR